MNQPVALRAGQAFWLSGIQSHLYVTLNTPAFPDDDVAVVNLTTWKPNCGLPVLFHCGDHPFIKQDTTVAPRFARVGPAKILIENINPHSTLFSHSQVTAIRKVLEGCPHTDKKVVAFLSNSP